MDRNHAPGGLGPQHDPSSRVQKTQSAAERMAEIKLRVSAAVGNTKTKGGLNVGLHPVLEDLGQWKPPSRTSDTRSLSTSAGARSKQEPANSFSTKKTPDASARLAGGARSNPYLDTSSPSQGAGGGERRSRQLVFNQKGKYIQQANALRRQAALEAMKKRIAEQTRKAGIDEDLDVEKNFQVPEPPEVEWWDEGLVGPDKGYDDHDWRVDTLDSIITDLIQHPVPLEPPQDKQMPAPKPMLLTQKEQAKIRRQRRGADLKEKQAKIRLGLEPAPPPKVKKGNLMRVLGEEAVKDPTAVEARVNREIAERRQKHLDDNEERKLTKEQRHEKLASNQGKDAAKGIHVLVFRIGSLANGQHRFKIGKNAEQLALTGICIMHPRLNLVVVEGGQWSINKYKKLMLNRIDWTENSPSRDKDSENGALREWLVAEDENGSLKDTSANKCDLVFEGEEKARAFRKWGSKTCETDSEARDILSRTKMENFWSQAKNAA